MPPVGPVVESVSRQGPVQERSEAAGPAGREENQRRPLGAGKLGPLRAVKRTAG